MTTGVVPGRCPVCAEALADKPLRRCATCETAAHEACAEFLGGCARYACAEAATPRGRVQRYVAERVVHEGATALLFSVPCLLAAWSLSNPYLVGLGLILAAAATRLTVQGLRMRHVAPEPARLVQFLKTYPPVVSDEMRSGTRAMLGGVLRAGLFGTAAWVAMMALLCGIFVISGFPVWELFVIFAMIAGVLGGLAAGFFVLLGGVMALSDRLTGGEGRPRWIGLADSWREEIEAYAAPPAPRLTGAEKPPPGK